VYYADKTELLRDLFGAREVAAAADAVIVDGRRLAVIDDVILAMEPAQYPDWLRTRLGGEPGPAPAAATGDFAPDIQSTFGAEWQEFPDILPEHETEFRQYFDLVDLESLRGQRICDLGCGIGRWSHFLAPLAREIVLVDFSAAIFVARRNLRARANAVFVMADIKRLPFRAAFADFVLCLGVLHHLPTDALDETRALARYAPRLLIYLYSAFDGRPLHYRILFPPVDALRRAVSRVHNPSFRAIFTWLALWLLYMPLIGLGHALRPLGLAEKVPLYDFYSRKSLTRIRQDVYDRFFTAIEQRVNRAQILRLADRFESVRVSPGIPQWHFLCERPKPPPVLCERPKPPPGA